MEVLFLTGRRLEISGVISVILDTREELSKINHDYDIKIVGLEMPGDEAFDSRITSKDLANNANHLPENLYQYDYVAANLDEFKNLLLELKTCIVFTNWMFDISRLCKELNQNYGTNIKVVGTCHGDSKRDYYLPLAKYCGFYDRIVTVSKLCRDNIIKYLPSSCHSKVQALPNVTIFPKTLERTYQISPIRLIYAGRLFKSYKRIMDLLPLIEELLSLDVDFIFDIYGWGIDEREFLEKLSKIEHNGKVRFKGFIPNRDIKPLMKEYDIFIQTSENEGKSIGLLEGMSYGLVPVITWNTDDVVTDNINGYVLEVGNAIGMAERVKYLSKHLHELQRLGTAARETIRIEQSYEQYIPRFIKFLDDLSEEDKISHA